MVGLTFASIVVKEVLSKLTSEIWKEISVQKAFKNDLKNMQDTLITLESVLKNAERQSISNEALRLWLVEVKHVCYDIQDMLSEFLVKHRSQSSDVCRNLLKEVRHGFSSLGSRLDMPHKLKNMRERLDNLVKRRKDFHLGGESSLDLQGVIKNRETVSKGHEEDFPSAILGREVDQEKIVGLILESKNQDDVLVIPIIGLGGLGKTTLAQLVFNDARITIDGYFDFRVWIYVSIEFDLLKIANSVLAAATGNHFNYINKLEDVARELRAVITEKKRYLIVLDDVWPEKMDFSQWETLKGMLSGGLSGMTIMVTTRSQRFTDIKGYVSPHLLEPLPDMTCFMLLKKTAFDPNEEKDYPELVEIGGSIAKKCGGVALVANALGSILHSERDERFWLNVRDSELWELHENQAENLFESSSREESRILSSLLLSYYFMPLKWKPCFIYCSIFPKGYPINKEDLIRQWISLGLISGEGKWTTRAVAELYMNNLQKMSFIQTFGQPTEQIAYQVHDVVHDLARLVAKDEIIDTQYERVNRQWSNGIAYRYVAVRTKDFETTMKLATKVRGIYLHHHIVDANANIFLSSISKFQSLLCFDLRSCSFKELPPILGSLLKLQYLNLSNCSCLVRLPHSLANLESLVYLDLSSCQKLEKLPANIGQLFNLQFLSLSHCGQLQSLPKSFGKLKNLEELRLVGLHKIRRLPTMRKMTDLRILSIDKGNYLSSLSPEILRVVHIDFVPLMSFFVHEMDGELGNKYCNIVDLQHMITVPCSKLSVKNLGSVKDPGDARRANMEKKKLSSLDLDFQTDDDLFSQKFSYCDYSELSKNVSILENLLPNEELENFQLSSYRGSRFPSWMMDRMHLCLPKLVSIILLIGKCDILPPLGQLPHLKYFTIESYGGVKKIGREFYGSGLVAFPSLEKLSITCMPDLEEWVTIFAPAENKEVSSFTTFPNLTYLKITGCEKVKIVPFLPPNIEELHTDNHSKSLTHSCCPLFPSPFLQINKLKILVLYGFGELIALPEDTYLPSYLVELEICNFSTLTKLPESVGQLNFLTKLTIRNCPRLESLPEGLSCLPVLNKIIILDGKLPLVQWYCSLSTAAWSKLYSITSMSTSGG